jgi:hypothetical protein
VKGVRLELGHHHLTIEDVFSATERHYVYLIFLKRFRFHEHCKETTIHALKYGDAVTFQHLGRRSTYLNCVASSFEVNKLKKITLMIDNALRYYGKIDEGGIVDFVDLLSGVLYKNLGPRKDIRKMCSFAIELLDNGMRYSIDNRVSFTWTIERDRLTFELENQASESDALRLQNHARELHGMDDAGRRQAFQDQINSDQLGARGGAGLGLLQILRKGALSIDIQIHRQADQTFVCVSRIQTPLQKTDKP